MPVNYGEKQYTFWKPKGTRVLDRLALLRQSNVNFIPFGEGRAIRTTPFLEDGNISWQNQYYKAGMAYVSNPLIFAAQNIINDELADARLIVEKLENGHWSEHTENTLTEWLKQPNPQMDTEELIRAYATHLHCFGKVPAVLFQKGDILPNGKICTQDNTFDIIYPTRIIEDNVTDKYRSKWFLFPNGYDEGLEIQEGSLFTDVWYNPVAHGLGISLPNNPLEIILDIHQIYLSQIRKLLRTDGSPTHLLTRRIDINKEPTNNLTDENIEEAVQKIYAQVGQQGKRPNGWLALRGDWQVKQMGARLPELMNKDLLQYIETNVSAVYKIPPSIFWAGLSASNQRASRQMDSIDFYNQKIHPLFARIENRLGDFLIPKFLGNTSEWRLHFDVDSMPLAQYVKLKKNDEFMQIWKLRILTFGEVRNKLNLPTEGFTEKELNERYSGGNQALSKDKEVDGGRSIPTDTENGLE